MRINSITNNINFSKTAINPYQQSPVQQNTDNITINNNVLLINNVEASDTSNDTNMFLFQQLSITVDNVNNATVDSSFADILDKLLNNKDTSEELKKMIILMLLLQMMNGEGISMDSGGTGTYNAIGSMNGSSGVGGNFDASV